MLLSAPGEWNPRQSLTLREIWQVGRGSNVCSCLDPSPGCSNPLSPLSPLPLSPSPPLPLPSPYPSLSCWELPSCPSLQLGHLRHMRGCCTTVVKKQQSVGGGSISGRVTFNMLHICIADDILEPLGSRPVASDINLWPLSSLRTGSLVFPGGLLQTSGTLWTLSTADPAMDKRC